MPLESQDNRYYDDAVCLTIRRHRDMPVACLNVLDRWQCRLTSPPPLDESPSFAALSPAPSTRLTACEAVADQRSVAPLSPPPHLLIALSPSTARLRCNNSRLSWQAGQARRAWADHSVLGLSRNDGLNTQFQQDIHHIQHHQNIHNSYDSTIVLYHNHYHQHT